MKGKCDIFDNLLHDKMKETILTTVTSFQNKLTGKEEMNEILFANLINFFVEYQEREELGPNYYIPTKAVSLTYKKEQTPPDDTEEINLRQFERKLKRTCNDTFSKTENIQTNFMFFENPLFLKENLVFLIKDESSSVNYQKNLLKLVNEFEDIEIFESKCIEDNKKGKSCHSSSSQKGNSLSNGNSSTFEGSSKVDNQTTFSLTKKTYEYLIKNMNREYINLLHSQYLQIKNKIDTVKLEEEVQKNLFVRLYQQLLLSMGINLKRIIDSLTRSLLFRQEKLTFDGFISSFDQLLRLSGKDNIFKYRFLLFIYKLDPFSDYISIDKLTEYLSLINCPLVLNRVIADEINNEILMRYIKIYKEEKKNVLKGFVNVVKLSNILEFTFPSF